MRHAWCLRSCEAETCLRDDVSDKLTERLVANLVGINQLSFLPCNNKKDLKLLCWFAELIQGDIN